jgi:DNA repair protein RecO (recombination protein O)
LVALEKTKALVLRTVDFSETSKVVTLFSREFGKLRALAKGGRRLKGSFEVALDLLSVCSISVIRKPTAELDLLTEAVLLERFDGLRRSLPALYAAYYVAEILDGTTPGAEPHPELFDATVATLRQLAEGADRLIELVRFQLRLLKSLGYAPNLDECAGCGANVELTSRTAFSVSAGGLVCPRCAPGQHAENVQGATIQLLRLLSAEGDAVERVAVSPRCRSELWRLTSSSLMHLLGRRPKTAGLLEL